MPTFDEIAEQYARRIQSAVHRDEIVASRSFTKSASAENLADALTFVGKELETWRISEDEKQQIVDEVARRIGYPHPAHLFGLFKRGSVDALVAVTQQMMDLFNALKSGKK